MRFTKIAAACFAMLLVGSLSYGQLGGGEGLPERLHGMRAG